VIINIAGTSGSGKSTVARALMALDPAPEPLLWPGRRSPIGYYLRAWPEVRRPVFLAGAYDAPTGGCDTIKDVGQVYDLIVSQHEAGCHVVYEGLFVMNHTRGIALWKATRALHVILLTTPLDECWRRIHARRAAVGNERPLGQRNTDGNAVRARNYAFKLSQIDCPVTKATSDEAPGVITRLLGTASDFGRDPEAGAAA
jgi:energy-coupling factor transporter ATP-binding protein EcfA2